MKKEEFEKTKKRLSAMRNKSVEEEQFQLRIINLLMISALKTYFELER